MKDRTQYIGGSDIAAICGVSPWGNPTTVWLEKTGQSIRKKESEAMFWGRALEDIIEKRFFENHSELVCLNHNLELRHPKHGFIGGEADAVYGHPKQGKAGVLEIKTTNQYNAKEWEDGQVPDHYRMQPQWYMMLMDVTEGYLAVLIGGQEYREVRVEADPALQTLMLQVAVEFWEKYVITKTAPPLIDPDIDTVKLLYPASNGQQITMADQAMLLPTLIDIKRDIKELEKRKDELEAAIQAIIGEAEAAITNDGKYAVTWKTVERKGFEVKPTTYRKFTVKEINPKRIEEA